jgi:hypothetical protein
MAAIRGFAVLLLAVFAVPARAQEQAPVDWVSDGLVAAAACDGRTLYIGGDFTVLVPRTGCGAELGMSGPASLHAGPRVDDEVRAAVSDGTGGWFIGGRFTNVGGRERHYLAHVLANGEVGARFPEPDSFVDHLEYRAGVLYIQGDFQQVDGVPRNGVAAIRTDTATLAPWDPRVENGVVYTLALDGPTVYLGGLFTSVNGRVHENLAAVDAVTGLVHTWGPRTDLPVRAIALSNGVVYLAGEFTRIGDQARNGMAAVNAATGAVLPWAPDARGALPRLLVDDGRVYVFGPDPLIVAGVFRNAAALDARTGAILPWDAHANGPIWTLARHGNDLLIGGLFTRLGETSRTSVGAVDRISGGVREWAPVALGEVHAIAVGTGTAYVGGILDGIGGVRRRWLAALDAHSGVPTDWAPELEGPFRGWVFDLAIHASTLYVAGRFDAVDGQSRGSGAAYDLHGMKLLPWDPRSDASRTRSGHLQRVVPTDSVVYLAGDFSQLGNVPRAALGAVRITDGAVTDWAPQLKATFPTPPGLGLAYELVAGNGALFVLGDFDTVNTTPRPQLGALDPATGATLPWAPPVTRETSLFSLASHDGEVVVGGTPGVRAFDGVTGALEWSATTPPGTESMLVVGNTLYYRGALTMGSIDLVTHQSTGWTATFGQTGFGGSVQRLVSNGRDLWAVGKFVDASQLGWDSFAHFRLPNHGGNVPRHGIKPALPEGADAPAFTAGDGTLRFTLERPARVSLAVFDVQGRRMAKLLNEEWRPGGAYELPIATSGWTPGVYLCRFAADGHTITRRMVVVR